MTRVRKSFSGKEKGTSCLCMHKISSTIGAMPHKQKTSHSLISKQITAVEVLPFFCAYKLRLPYAHRLLIIRFSILYTLLYIIAVNALLRAIVAPRRTSEGCYGGGSRVEKMSFSR